jgi:hypothetical protein
MKQYFTLIFIVTATVYSAGQNFDLLNLPIKRGNIDLTLNQVAGLRSPQFSNIDFNNDGVQDLFVFEKNGDKIIPLVKTGASGSLSYRYAPEYISQFPKLTSWALLADYNKDGLMDIFTSFNSCSCIQMFVATKNNAGIISYKSLKFNNGPSLAPEILTYKQGNFHIQVYATAFDIPAIVDVDDDGDIDILSFDSGGGQVFYHKNLNIEENLEKDSVKFHLQDACWGRFIEDQSNDVIRLGKDTLGCGNNFAPHNDGTRHSGSTTTIFDLDGDGLKDILIGDISSNFVKYLKNGGTKTKAFMTAQIEQFPDDNPINIFDFVAVYNVDADGDGVKDIIASPNNVANGQNSNFIWFYKNVGTSKIPKYQLVTKNFLVEAMPFFFGGSHPAFADVDADGLLDLVIGTTGLISNNGLYTKKLVLAINTGDDSHPAFNIVDEDYLQFSKDSSKFGRLAPNFGDLDDDGDIDLMIGNSAGQLLYFENIAGKDKPMRWANGINGYGNFNEIQNAKPFIFDLDKDGLKDIIMGKRNVELIFYKNIGSRGQPKFNPDKHQQPNDVQLGNMLINSNSSEENASPFIIQTLDQKMIILIGTERAGIKSFDQVENNIYQDFNLLSNNTGNINTGKKMTISLADIDSDGYYEMAVGNETGGLNFYNTIFKVDTISATLTTVNTLPMAFWPNPAQDELMIQADDDGLFIELCDIFGQSVQSLKAGFNTLRDVPSGMYFIRWETQQGMSAQKLVIQK